MKTIHVILTGAVMLLCGWSVQAAAMVSPESCSTGTPAVGSIFSFQADANGGSALFPHSGGLLKCMFNNATTQNFNNLMITTPLPAGTSLTAFTCGGNLFNICTVGLNPAGDTLLFNFSLGGGNSNVPPPGIPRGTEFAINLGTGGPGGFAPGQTFLAAANGATVPEPASAMLILAGVAAMLVRRRARQQTT